MQIQIPLDKLFSDVTPVSVDRYVAEIQERGLCRSLAVFKRSNDRYRVIGASLPWFWALRQIREQRQDPLANDLILCHILS